MPREIWVSTVFSDIRIRAAISRCGMSLTRRRTKASRVLSGIAAIARASWRSSSRSIACCSGEAASSAMLQPFQVVDGVDRDDARATDMAHDHRARDLEQIGARMADGVHGLQLGQDRIGLLDDVVGIDARRRRRESQPLSAGSCGRMFRRNHRVLCLSAPLIPDPLAGHCAGAERSSVGSGETAPLQFDALPSRQL
jgi:hypothetical protein